MNCQEFAGIVNELAGPRLMDAVTRQRALRHSEACAQCKARLMAERELTARLHAFAEETKVEQAPARVREALRAACAQHRQAAQVVVPMPARQAFWQTRWAVIAAAALLVLLAGAASLWLRHQTAERKEGLSAVKPTPMPTPMRGIPASIEPPQNAMRHLAKRSENKRAITKPLAPRLQAAVSTNANEVATNYIPLTYATHAPQNGVVVRVEMARATLFALGLPLNAERSNELIKADVMMSGDGVPLAIRLVQR